MSALLMTLTLLSMISCRNHVDFEDYYYNTAEQRLADTFYKMYGRPEATEDWNDATQVTLDIELPAGEEYRVMVFTGNPTVTNDAFYLADYKQVGGGSNKLQFDAPETLTEVYVGISDKDRKTNVQRADVVGDKVTAVFQKPTEELSFSAWQMRYYIAFEDLGIAIDLDYNDVVLGVTWVSGSNTADVELLAIGTTLYTHVLFQEEELYEGKELHDILGIRNTTLVNTFGPNATFTLEERRLSLFNSFNFPRLKQTIEVPDGFSIAKDAGMFCIKTSAGANPKDEEIKTSRLPEKPGQVPFAMLKADPKWEWPSEGQPIMLNTAQTH